MSLFRTYRAKLQAAFVGLGLAAIGLTGWEASSGATAALRQATFERLTAIHQSRCRQIERYFHDLGQHVLALSGDESTVAALEEFRAAWGSIPPAQPAEKNALRARYGQIAGSQAWFPADPRVVTLQHSHSTAGGYGRIYARHHPTLQRYRNAFGFYDVLLIDVASGRVLYSVLQEIDLGVPLREPPYREGALAKAFEAASRITAPEQYAIRDYEPYIPSQNAPAAFVAAPVWRDRQRLGVLAIQVSAEEVSRVMTADGLGETGRAYIVGADGLLRSGAGILTKATPAGELRSQARIDVPGLDWAVVAEIAEREAFAPAAALRNRILGLGAAIAVAFFAGAAVLARSVSRPVSKLVEGTRRLGGRDFSARLEQSSNDEFGQLAASFNRMAEDLARTTVSKEELEKLAGKLITAQEDERRRIARELHDDLTQRLAAVAIEAGGMEKIADADAARWREGLRKIKEQMAALSLSVAGLSRSLHPSMLDELGLLAAIQSEARASFERGGPPVELDLPNAVEGLSRDAQLGLFRIVQEALTNVRKHAQAESAMVRLWIAAGEAVLTITDDGQGFERTGPEWRAGLGLASMEERARLLSGRFEVSSRPGNGTTMEVRLPIG